MRFLVDECTGPRVAAFLREQGHEVFSVFEQARGADDDTLLKKAFAEKKVHRERRPHRGVVFLRLADERAANKILVLERLLAQYAEQLPDRFVVVTDERVRFAGVARPSLKPE